MNQSIRNALIVIFIAIAFIVSVRFLFKTVDLWSDSEGENPDEIERYNTDVAAEGIPTISVAAVAPVSVRDHIRGARDAQLSIVEFSDLECPFCKAFHPTMQQLLSEYTQVNWVYRHFPIKSKHPKAVTEAEAAECAGFLGGERAFWYFIDSIFENTASNNTFDQTLFLSFAQELKLPLEEFQTCVESGQFRARVDNDVSQALAAGARATPFSLIMRGDDRIPISGAFTLEQMRELMEDLLGEE
jgi:protein-disulfide isomerase